MLSRFIVPVAMLNRLPEFRDDVFAAFPPFPLGVSGKHAEDESHFVQTIEDDLQTIEKLHNTLPGWVRVDVLETGLPAALFTGEQNYTDIIAELSALLEDNGPRYFSPFLEIPWADGWNDNRDTFIKTLAKQNRSTEITVGIKVSTGGATPEAFPGTDVLAHIIGICRDHNIPLKMTGGLLHPFRHHDESMNTDMHGFINVITAVTLARTAFLEYTDIETILKDQNADHFILNDEGIAYGDWSASTDDISLARQQGLVSIGIEDLHLAIDSLRKSKLL